MALSSSADRAPLAMLQNLPGTPGTWANGICVLSNRIFVCLTMEQRLNPSADARVFECGVRAEHCLHWYVCEIVGS